MSKIFSPLSRAAKTFKNHAAVISPQGTLTYFEFNQYVIAAMDRLVACGIKKRHRVAILLPNSPEGVICFIALWRLQAVACPLSRRFPFSVINKTLSKIETNAIICQSGDLRRITKTGIRKIPINGIVRLHAVPMFQGRQFQMTLERDAAIFLTSGTTTLPKAVLHTFGSLYFNASGSNKNIPLNPGDRWLLSLPLYHVGGLGIVFRCLLAGAAVVIPERNESLANAIRKYRVSHISMVATQLNQLTSEIKPGPHFKSLKAVLIGGGPISNDLILRALKLKLPIYKTYGLTEMASQVSTTSPSDEKDKLFTSGKILPFRKIRIAKDGEILVKGKTLCKGDVGARLPLTRDGWFQTGDLGKIDSAGYLHVLGRRDNMFISGGENIYPEEIEESLCRLGGVTQACVLAVPHKRYGARPIAFIKRGGLRKLSGEALRRELARYLPRFKIPDKFYQWPRQGIPEGTKLNRPAFLGIKKIREIL